MFKHFDNIRLCSVLKNLYCRILYYNNLHLIVVAYFYYNSLTKFLKSLFKYYVTLEALKVVNCDEIIL